MAEIRSKQIYELPLIPGPFDGSAVLVISLGGTTYKATLAEIANAVAGDATTLIGAALAAAASTAADRAIVVAKAAQTANDALTSEADAARAELAAAAATSIVGFVRYIDANGEARVAFINDYGQAAFSASMTSIRTGGGDFVRGPNGEMILVSRSGAQLSLGTYEGLDGWLILGRNSYGQAFLRVSDQGETRASGLRIKTVNGVVEVRDDDGSLIFNGAGESIFSAGGGGGGGFTPRLLPAVQCADRCGVPSNSETSVGVEAWNSRLIFNISSQCTGWAHFRIREANISRVGSGPGPNPFTVLAALEYPLGQPAHRVFWGAGQAALTLEPGAEAVSDIISIWAPGGGQAAYRTHLTVPPGGLLVRSYERYVASEGGGFDTSATDKSLTGSIAAVNDWAIRTPLAIEAVPSSQASTTGNAVAGLAILGDSITEGRDDTEDSYYGWMVRGAAQGGIGYVRKARSGQTFLNFDTLAEQRLALYGTEGCTHLICGFGTNDLNAGASLVQMQARAMAMCETANRMGMVYIGITLGPRTNLANDGGFYGTDDATKRSLLQDYNNWMRSNPFPAGNKVFDAAAVQEDPSNPTRWRTDLGQPMSDGLHPLAVMHAALRDAFAAALPNLLAV